MLYLKRKALSLRTKCKRFAESIVYSLQSKSGNQTDAIKRAAFVIDEPEDEDGVAIGRTTADAPEIDGIIYVTTDTHLNPGDIVNVKVTANQEYDLIGRHIVS